MRASLGVRSLRSSLSLSIFVHVVLILICATLLRNRAARVDQSEKKWTIVELAPSQPPKHIKDTVHQKVVETSRATPTETAAKDAFLGERTQTADRQTVSKNHQIAMGKDTSKPTPSAEDRERKASSPQHRVAEQKATAPVAVQSLGLAIMPSQKKQEEFSPKERDDRRWASAGEQLPQDYVKGMKESERTVLNTKEFVFFGYYQRIRERLDRAWVPILRANVAAYYRRGRTLASDDEHTTKVMVVLDGEGRITKVEITSESGTADLDDAAVKAFNLAGPFPNPPRGIVDNNGEIKIPWEFILRT
jgi:TonB family protein